MEKIRIWDGKVGSDIRDKYPGSATLLEITKKTWKFTCGPLDNGHLPGAAPMNLRQQYFHDSIWMVQVFFVEPWT
jgi:hypothetical protein